MFIPKAHSFEFVEGCIKDPLVVVKLLIFIAIAKIVVVQQFLTTYQCDKPMTSFLYQDRAKMMKSLLQKFVASKVVVKAYTSGKLCKLDITDPANHFKLSKVDFGFAANEELLKLKRSKVVSNLQCVQINSECKSFVLKVTAKLQEKCLLKYLTSLNLAEIPDKS